MKYTQTTRLLALAFLLALFAGGQVLHVEAQGCDPKKDPLICRPDANSILLLQPLDDETKNLNVSPEPLQVFFDYFNMSWPWLLGVASGIAVLQAIYGGVLIMLSGGDIDEGKTKIQWALGGMVMIALAGFILRFLNPTFYQ